jgi:uroporphyrinogen-III synthase
MMGPMALGSLEGYVVAVTADRRAGEQAELLRRRGAKVLHAPTIATGYLTADDAVQRATRAAIESEPDFLVLVTSIGWRAWLEAAQAWGLDADLLRMARRARVLARGPKATAAAHAAGVDVWRSAVSEELSEVIDILRDVTRAGARVVVQCHGEDDPRLRHALVPLGVEVIEVPVYRWRQPRDRRPARELIRVITEQQVDAVTFTAAPALRNLLRIADEQGLRDRVVEGFNGGVLAACVGPVCEAAAREAGIEAPVAPEVGRLGLLVRVVAEHLGRRAWSFRVGEVEVRLQGRALEVDGSSITLGHRERVILTALLERSGAVVPPRALPGPGGGGHARSVELAVARLRRKLGPAAVALETVRRRGYRLVVTDQSQGSGSETSTAAHL